LLPKYKYINANNRGVLFFYIFTIFQTLQSNPTDKFQKLLTKALQQCDLIVKKKQLKCLIQENTQPPTLKAQIKIHKSDYPIRPVVNNINFPTYKISKLLVNKPNGYLNRGRHYNVKDSITLDRDLTKLKIDEKHRMITFDIKDLYVNIPIKETLRITTTLLSQYNNEHTTKQIITLLEIILQQNYFSFQDKICQHEKGFSMGSPISNTIAEIFLQYLENTHLKNY
jgi:hypothetical protein